MTRGDNLRRVTVRAMLADVGNGPAPECCSACWGAPYSSKACPPTGEAQAADPSSNPTPNPGPHPHLHPQH